ncbi:hypothetical protein HZH68_001059 [Vespula germanica]|uniref:Uncharacterized protein n=1 Tax=Vespula germanica TaxID=30212 RepID=A0A834NUU5_VESGE|nr:hypothetical protein HZH68_001059 [Vespula germanica]
MHSRKVHWKRLLENDANNLLDSIFSKLRYLGMTQQRTYRKNVEIANVKSRNDLDPWSNSIDPILRGRREYWVKKKGLTSKDEIGSREHGLNLSKVYKKLQSRKDTNTKTNKKAFEIHQSELEKVYDRKAERNFVGGIIKEEEKEEELQTERRATNSHERFSLHSILRVYARDKNMDSSVSSAAGGFTHHCSTEYTYSIYLAMMLFAAKYSENEALDKVHATVVLKQSNSLRPSRKEMRIKEHTVSSTLL